MILQPIGRRSTVSDGSTILDATRLAGVEDLLVEAGIQAEEIQSFIEAGAFGSYLDIGSDMQIGMFPDNPRQRFQQVGNAAG